MAQSPETQHLVHAIQQFLSNPPKGIPPEILDGLHKVGQVLAAGPPGPVSPGRQAVNKATGGQTAGAIPGGNQGPTPGAKAAVAAQMGN